MKHRPAPTPPRPGRLPKRLAHDRQVKKWAKRLEGDPEARPDDLNEEQLTYLMREVHRRRQHGAEFNPTFFEQAMAKTTPVLAAPEMDDPIADLEHVFAQPEVQEAWRYIVGRRGERGPAPSWGWTKAVMSVLAMTGVSAHVDDAMNLLRRDDFSRRLFERVELAARGRDLGRFPSYPTVCRLMPQISMQMTRSAMHANVDMLKALREMMPKAGIGKRLLVDGTSIPAWAPQVGSGGNDEEERKERDRRMRRFAPDAGFRAYYYASNGKRSIQPGDKLANGLRAGRGKAWRGYFLVVIADQATGLPLSWTLQDAAINETWGLIPCLSELHRLWPDIDADCIAGDGLYDTDEIARMLEVDYGIHPCFRDEGNRSSTTLESRASRDNTIASITADGRLVCSRHQKPLDYETVDAPSRTGVRPGQSTDERRFRLRGKCLHGPNPCGRLGLQMQNDWSRLTFYPKHGHGNPRRQAHRLAMISRLNGIEQLFNRLKTGKKLGTVGTDRSRVREMEKHEALISLAFMSMTALTVADVREQRDESPELAQLDQLRQAAA